MRIIFFTTFLFLFFSAFSQRKTHSKLLLGIHFPGAGFSQWNITGDNLHFRKPDNLIHEKFKGEGLNIFYGIDLLYGKKLKAGFAIGQQFFHVHQFTNSSESLTLEPVFYSAEQTHFHKLLLQVEVDLHNKRVKWGWNMQGGVLLPKRIFEKEYIEQAWTVNGGPIVSFWLSHKTDFYARLSGEYILFVHHAGQNNSLRSVSLNQASDQKTIYNKIYSLNLNFGIRVNLLHKTRTPRFRSEPSRRFPLL